MTVTAIPATSFAGTTNRVAKVVTAQVDDIIETSISFEDKGDTSKEEQITVTLTNAEWDEAKMKALSSEGATDAIEKAEKALEDAKADKKAADEAKEAADIIKEARDADVQKKVEAYNTKHSTSVTKDEVIAEDADLDTILANAGDEKDAVVAAVDTYKKAAAKAADAATKATAAEKAVTEAQKALDDLNAGGNAESFEFELITDKEALFTFKGYEGKDIRMPIIAEITDEGDVQATIDPMSSNITGGTYTVAIGADGGSKTTIEKSTDIADSSTQIKPIVITETTAGSFKEGEIIKVKLGGNFVYTDGKDPKVTTPSGDGEVEFVKVDDDTIEIKVTKKSTKATKIVIDNIWIEEDDAEVGNEAEITVSGAGTSKTTLTVAKYVDYGFSFEAEDEEVPVIYSGRENGDTDVLKVTFKETAPKSWFTGRKVTITLPEGVKFTSAEVSDKDNIKTEGTVTIDSKDRTIANIEGFTVVDGKKGEVELEFDIEVSPEFTGRRSCYTWWSWCI